MNILIKQVAAQCSLNETGPPWSKGCSGSRSRSRVCCIPTNIKNGPLTCLPGGLLCGPGLAEESLCSDETGWTIPDGCPNDQICCKRDKTFSCVPDVGSCSPATKTLASGSTVSEIIVIG